MLQTVKSEKLDEKKWVHLSSFYVSFLSYGPSILQKSAFLQFWSDLRRKPKSAKENYRYASENSYYNF